MPPNVHTPGSAGTPDPQIDISAELQRRKEDILNRVLGNLTKVTTDERSKIMDVLGANTPESVQKKHGGVYVLGEWTPGVLRGDVDLSPDKPEIVRVLLQQQGAVAALMPEVLKPGSKRIQIGSRLVPVKNVVLDPESEDAKILINLYRMFEGWTNPEWEKILSPSPLNPDDVKRLKQVEELRAEYAALRQDASYHNLKSRKDRLLTEEVDLRRVISPPPPPAPTPGAGSPVTVNVGGNQPADSTAQVQQAHARLALIGTEISTIDAKRTELENRLTEIDKKGLDVTSPPSPAGIPPAYVASPGIVASLDAFGAHTPPPFAWSSMLVAVGGENRSAEKWMTDADAGAKIAELKVRAKRGNAKISANAALDEMLKDIYRKSEPGASEAEIDALVREMRAVISQRPSAGAPGTPSAPGTPAAPDASKKFLGSTWLHALGGNNLYNWWWNLDEEGKEKPPAEKKESSESWWTSFTKYMNDDSKNFLGFDVPKKKG